MENNDNKDKFFIMDKNGELVNVTKEEYQNWKAENEKNYKEGNIPKFESLEKEGEDPRNPDRYEEIEELLEELNNSEREMERLEENVIEEGNREDSSEPEIQEEQEEH